jgi:uncharacterized protein (DUF1800 family)
VAHHAWTQAHVRRLFWRAGFGATPHEARRWARAGRSATLRHVLRGGAGLSGPAPRLEGQQLDPVNQWGHDVLWWLDRMVRSRHPLQEKLTLFWHDHFATSDQDTPLMLAQNRMLRAHSLGSFRALLGAVTRDPAMQLFLSLADSDKEAPNENFARELMELFTLGSGYSERDIREAARALTGFQSHWGDNGFNGITYEAERHDSGVKVIFGKKGRFDWHDVLDLVVHHPAHAPFLVGKLWDFFITDPPGRSTLRHLARVYRRSGFKIKPVVGEILGHRALYRHLDAPDMVKAPVVYLAGMLRTTGQGIDRDDWAWQLDMMGQYPFHPPSVAGWDWGPAWMSTNSIRGRFVAANTVLDTPRVKVASDAKGDPDLKAAQALDLALKATGRPWISGHSRAVLLGMARTFYSDMTKSWQESQKPQRAAMLQRVLRQLLLAGPDAHLH